MRLFLYDLVTFCMLSGAQSRYERKFLLEYRTARRPSEAKG